MPAYTSPSSFAVEDDGGSVASMTSLASKESQVRENRFNVDTKQAGMFVDVAPTPDESLAFSTQELFTQVLDLTHVTPVV